MKIHQHKTIFFCLVMVGLLLGTVVFADSGERPATPSEKAFYSSVMSTFIKATPPKPEGWDQTIFCHDTELVRVTSGLEKYPLRVYYFTGWQDTKAVNTGQERLAAEVMALSKDPANFTSEKMEAIEKKVTPHDVTVRIDVQANYSSMGITEAIKPAPAIADGLVYRSDSKWSGGSWNEGTTYIFLGKGWQLNKSAGTYMNFTFNKSIPSLTVQNIVVKIKADPNRAQTIAQKIDWDSLKKLIKN